MALFVINALLTQYLAVRILVIYALILNKKATIYRQPIPCDFGG